MRERCLECGRKETWREWWSMRRDRRAWKKNPPPKDIFVEWVADSILDEIRPMRRIK